MKALRCHLQLAIVQGKSVWWKYRAESLSGLRPLSEQGAGGSKKNAGLLGIAESYFDLAQALYGILEELTNAVAVELGHDPYYNERQIAATLLGSVCGKSRKVREGIAEGHRRLNEAQAILQEIADRCDPLAPGIVELHRAELNLYHAAHLGGDGKVHRDPDGVCMLLDLRNKIFAKLPAADEDRTPELLRYYYNVDDESSRSRAQAASAAAAAGGPARDDEREQDRREKGAEGDDERRFRPVLRLLADAADALDRAEVVLTRNRKDVWWSTWLFELKMKLIEYELVVSVDAHGKEIPHVGLQAAPRGSLTEADNLLINTQRMMRLDVARLARVVESYARCLWIVTYRLATERGLETMPLRQDRMTEMCRKSWEMLERLYERRKKIENPPLDPVVKEYVGEVIEFVRRVLANVVIVCR